MGGSGGEKQVEQLLPVLGRAPLTASLGGLERLFRVFDRRTGFEVGPACQEVPRVAAGDRALGLAPSLRIGEVDLVEQLLERVAEVVVRARQDGDATRLRVLERGQRDREPDVGNQGLCRDLLDAPVDPVALDAEGELENRSGRPRA